MMIQYLEDNEYDTFSKREFQNKYPGTPIILGEPLEKSELMYEVDTVDFDVVTGFSQKSTY